MSYTAKAVANAFLDIARSDGKGVSPLKLQKLVYISHGWSWAIFGKPLVTGERPEAWQYGPVFPSIYHEFKSFGRKNVDGYAQDVTKSGPGFLDFTSVIPKIPEEDRVTLDFLDVIWQKYGKFSGLALSDATHKENTPWSRIWNESGGAKNADIPDDMIAEHYRTLAKARVS